MKNKIHFKKYHLSGMLVCLTALFILGQISFFIVHYKLSGLFDALSGMRISHQMIHPVILFPIVKFIFIQLSAYFFFICWIWFISVLTGDLFKLSNRAIYYVGIVNWIAGCSLIFILNYLQFPNSLFASTLRQYEWMAYANVFAIVTASLLCFFTLFAYINFFLFKRYKAKRYGFVGAMLLLLGLMIVVLHLNDKMFLSSSSNQIKTKPNIILIGLDSLRPDFTNQPSRTPHVDHFLHTSTHFTQAYTPLARTFPAWISILTAKYPKHNHARNNLVDPLPVLANDTIARRLKEEGYETIYATDEKRFSNITEEYGFDHILGPGMGVNDFILGGLSDFPLSNLLVNLPGGRFLFPYNYANRAATITYEPDAFLQLVKRGLQNRTNKPLFLAVHLCLSHWPFTWAHDGQSSDAVLSERYRSSVSAVDNQLGELLKMLKENGLLENSLVVLLSDHGTTVGLPGDRIIDKKNYVGDQKKLNVITVSRLGSAPEDSLDFQHDYVINTSYGQGDDVLSLKQNHVLLAFKRYGVAAPVREVRARVSLMDIAPTILDVLQLPPMKAADGISVASYLSKKETKNKGIRPFFMETGDKVVDTETDKIVVEKVIKDRAGVYQIKPNDGTLILNPAFEKTTIMNKQRSVLLGDWLLARYPSETRLRLTHGTGKQKGMLIPTPYVIQPYYVLVNVKTGKWTIGLSSSFAESAPLKELLRQFNMFYGDEI